MGLGMWRAHMYHNMLIISNFALPTKAQELCKTLQFISHCPLRRLCNI